jgi:hypothetical protein
MDTQRRAAGNGCKRRPADMITPLMSAMPGSPEPPEDSPTRPAAST